MSDTTLLANQYAASAEFLQQMNSALLELKKAWFGSRRPQALLAGELRRRRDDLARLVEGVVARLENHQLADLQIPEELVERLRSEFRGQLEWRVPDLKAAASALRGEGQPEKDALSALDDLCQLADATATASFRRLWRR